MRSQNHEKCVSKRFWPSPRGLNCTVVPVVVPDIGSEAAHKRRFSLLVAGSHSSFRPAGA